MKFKTDLHVHTAEASFCAKHTATEVADRYIAEGYSGLVITNHYSPYTVDHMGDAWSIDAFLLPYRRMREHAGDRLHVLLGAELRFEGDNNDYLIYGLTEDFLYRYPDLHLLSLKKFVPLAHEHGLLVIQAHPFRDGMILRDPKLLDGVEVFNASPPQSRNHFALDWAKHYELIPTSGSDLHTKDHPIGGGILTDTPMETVEQLVEILRARTATLICEGPGAERDRMHTMAATLDEA